MASDSARLAILSRYEILDTPPEPAFDELAQLAAQICDVPIALINFIDDHRQWFKSGIGVAVRETGLEMSLCAQAIRNPHEDLVIPDALADPRFANHPFVTGPQRIRFYHGAPILSREGQPLGTLCVMDRVPRTLTEAQVTALHALRRAVSAQLERRRHATELPMAVLERVTDAFVALDVNWNYVWVNAKAAQAFGRTPDQMIGKHIWTEFPEGVGKPFQLAYQRAMKEQVPVQLEEYYEPYDRWFENRIYPSKDGLSIFFSDITERKHAEQLLRTAADQQRRLAQRTQAAREEEQRHLAREIHDRLGQSLTMLKLGLSRLPPDEQVLQLMHDVDETIKATRQISAELRPPLLEDLGLGAALEWAGQRFEERTGIEVKCTLEDVDLTQGDARALYEIAQEALTNIVRHAGASLVTLRLVRRDAGITVEVSDDGKGFDHTTLADPHTLGLLGMHERADAIGAMLDISSVPGKGTTVCVNVPLERGDDTE